MKLLLILSYLGTNFYGYQVQTDKRTVQGELTRASRELFGFDCDITGCSRTDTGVHANMFCATVTNKGEDHLDTHIDISRIAGAMNAHLPCDISVLEAKEVNDSFHPRYDVKYKEYVYRIYNGRTRDPFEEGRSWHVPYTIFDSNGINRMQAAADKLVGEHDFTSFMASGSSVLSTVRNVKYVKVEKEGDVVLLKIAADGFLYNMVRIITGTLVDVARGKFDPNDIENIIRAADRRLAGATAPPQGLYLNKVEY